MIESKVEVRKGDILILHTGWHRYAQFGEEADEERYIRMHPGPHRDLVPWLLEKEIKIWGLDAVSTDHPMNLPIGRFLGKGQFGQCDRVRVKAEHAEAFGQPLRRPCQRGADATLLARGTPSVLCRPQAARLEGGQP